MKISRFEVRILSGIVAVALVTLVGALWFGYGAVSEAYRVGVNTRVLGQLRSSLGVYRTHFVALRDDAERTADAVAFDRRGHEALVAGDLEGLERFVEGACARYPNVAAVTFEDARGETLVSVREAERLDPSENRLLSLVRPTADGGRVEVTIATAAAPFAEHQRAGELVEVYARLVGGATYVSGFYVGVYITFLLSVIVVALAIGIIVSRRVTRRVALLVEATERVGQGDLSVSVPSDGRDEVAELTRSFNAMVRDIRESRDRIEYLQRIGAWQDFARRLAHEIKNPLTPIQLAVQQVHRTYEGDDPRYQRTVDDATAIVEEEVATLRRLVGEFSEFARLPVAALEDEDVGAFVQEALRGLSPESLMLREDEDAGRSAPALEIEVEETPMRASLDKQMLRRVLDNLVRNAVHSVAASEPEGGGRVRVVARLEGPQIVLEVRDDGPGVDAAERERVFDPYFTTKTEGTGLGLAIAKKVVLEHGGSIGCHEAPEGGACFRIRLPVLPQAPEPRA